MEVVLIYTSFVFILARSLPKSYARKMLNSGKFFHPITSQLRHVPSQVLKRQEYRSTEQGLGLGLGF